MQSVQHRHAGGGAGRGLRGVGHEGVDADQGLEDRPVAQQDVHIPGDHQVRGHARRDVEIPPDVADVVDHFLDVVELGLSCLVGVLDDLGERGNDASRGHEGRNAVCGVGLCIAGPQARQQALQELQDLLGDEGGNGVHQAEGSHQHGQQHPLLVLAEGRIPHLPKEDRLHHLHIIRTELVPEERIGQLGRTVKKVPLQVGVHLCRYSVQAGQDPLVFQCEERRVKALLQVICSDISQVHDHEPRPVPDLVREVLVILEAAAVQVNLPGLCGAGGQGHPHGVRPVAADDGDGVQHVALGLGHLLPLGLHPLDRLPGVQLRLLLGADVRDAPLLVGPPVGLAEDEPLQGHILEGDLAKCVLPHENHAGHPEEEDVVPGDQHGVGVELLHVRAGVGPAQRAEGPQGRGVPGVQDVLVLLPSIWLGCHLWGHTVPVVADHCLWVILPVPDRDAVPPPQLPGDAPVAEVLNPVEVCALPLVGDELRLPVLNSIDQGLLELGHGHKPLLGHIGLNDGLRPVGLANTVLVGLNLV
mmetsp:Transcript_4894/g.8933  ORF Transcript_4894/g.8933 Transcript_4894/m.8933 type:complete len:529 (-) Transcript_4894:1560-3146(-)